MSCLNMEMRLLTLILLWFVCNGQAVPIMEENAVIAAESESANNPTTTLPQISTSAIINSNSESEPNFQMAEKQDINVAAGNAVDEEAAAAERMATAIVAPLTHIAHITYDSEPATHKPNADKPLFHREPHDELIAL
ncbi:PREDICTED: uncharacterized protein LOC108966984 [Bactrocera latifrons]|uniref:Uncharacterized protein n=1 Tax=Bactrocera latifrons TaxID=174628 RepID=A0A0K8VE09_BACLA|nr:PREDICTED: uncharacterized protein LOC108966984 [Bactrocera latifrons]